MAHPDGPPRGRATGGGTAPDTRRPSQRWRTTPSGTAPTTPAERGPHRACKPRGQRRAPTPAHPRPQQEWMTDPDSPPRGRTVGGGGAPDRPAAQTGGTAHGPPPPPQPAPRHTNATDPPDGGRTAPSQVGGNRDLTAPREGTPDGARDRGRTRGGARTTWNGPTSAQCRDRSRCARHTTQGGGNGRRGSASAQTRKEHAGTTRRATGPSSRIAQTAWNGLPASEGKGHLDGTARHTQRGTRGAERGKRVRHNTRYRPEPPEPAASAAHTGTGHCTRQGSSGALRHAPTPKLGSLRPSPRGSHWRQTSSTGPAAPAPRATTH